LYYGHAIAILVRPRNLNGDGGDGDEEHDAVDCKFTMHEIKSEQQVLGARFSLANT
jgi:hypothetical protein